MAGYWNAHSDRDWQDECGMYDEPEPDDEPELYGCDCCGAEVPREQIAMVIAYGIETAACCACRGVEPEEDA